MGCSTSKLDDEESVQLCKDRKKFIKQAVEQRMKFASGHSAYILSMRRVSAALRDYIEVDEPREFLLDSFKTPPFAPIKKSTPGFITISPTSFSVTPLQSEPKTTIKVNYFRAGGNPAVSIEERPQSPETFRVEAYSPIHQYGMDGFFSMQTPPMTSSFFHYSPENRPNLPPPSPQTSQWDFFWNPFSSLDYYGYSMRNNLDQTIMDDDVAGLRQVREEEGIPELEEETELEDNDHRGDARMERAEVERTRQDARMERAEIERTRGDVQMERAEVERTKAEEKYGKEEVVVEDVDDNETESGTDTEHEFQGLETHGKQSIEVSKSQNVGQVSTKEATTVDCESRDETPGFTVYVNRRPTSMAEVIKDLEAQFMIACDSANELSEILEARRAQYAMTPNDHTALKMLNPVALIRSASSRSSSSRFLSNSTAPREDASCQSGSDFSEESNMFLHSHQSTLDRLYAWEKKLYQEVREGERVRIAYEKKCTQLRNQDVKGADPSSLDKTRAAIRDLQTQIKVSLHSAEAVSKRIETLRDEELQPQLQELVQGLARMWKVMAECHQLQKRTLDEAKILLAGASKLSTPKKYTLMSPSEPHRLARSAANLETEIRNWRACFESWIVSQRSYIHALTGWLLRCVRTDPDISKLPFSPRRSKGVHPIFVICIQWSRFLDSINEVPVVDGLDMFAAGVGSIYAQQLREDSRRTPGGSKRFVGEPVQSMEVVEVGQVEEEVLTAEKMAEVAIKVLCAGMSIAVNSLTEFACGSAEGYSDLMKQWQDVKLSQNSSSGTST